ncbi:SMC-Scp complex subunit ScpB [Dethiothermospora halolimnae]|uniref:SMC-Scp complex subunit ScpB n=1 Tax=Dethiothermospora halolimnae TaxID=3114390 RepID=UPI003CCBEAD1
MDKREVKSVIEALLFVWGEPLEIKEISTVLDLDKKYLKEVLDEMINEFNYYRRGIQIIQIDNSYQLSTRSEHFDFISKLCTPKKDKQLSNAALETLSIIAYKQPITRIEVEEIRGVKCDKSISTLIEKNLVKEVGRLDKTGRPKLYGTTDNFLKHFGLTCLDQLPEIKEIEKIDEDLEDITGEENNT